MRGAGMGGAGMGGGRMEGGGSGAPGGDGRWSDLGPRVATALVLALVGAAAIWAGGWSFRLLSAVITGAILWEMRRMVSPRAPWSAWLAAAVGGATVLAAAFAPGWTLAPSVGLAAAVAALAGPPSEGNRVSRPVVFAHALTIVVAGHVLTALRDEAGAGAVLWLVGAVAASDIAGYFAGKAIGGPKFWPAVSPKKTWAGVVAGWLGAAAVGAVFAAIGPGGARLVLLSMLVALASQLGDIAQSALKRRCGVKDSSALLPGHGGVWDRFDALLGAALAVFLLKLAGLVPVGGGALP